MPSSPAISEAKAARDYATGLVEWRAFRAEQNAACSPFYDSQEILTGHHTAMSVIVLHGYSMNPQGMQAYIDLFRDYDVNVLAPRLAGHFNERMTDLDDVGYRDWVVQVESTYRAAKKLGTRVVVLGYSLGGLLATRLALDHPQIVEALVLLSPAWRVTGRIELGSNFGWALGISGNQFLKKPYGCDSDKAYWSAHGGMQVDILGSSSELAFHGTWPSTDSSAFRRMTTVTPSFLALMDRDNVVSTEMALDIFHPLDSGFRTLLIYPGEDHGTLADPGKVEGLALSSSHSLSTDPSLLGQIRAFLAEQVSLAPAPVGMPLRLHPY
jgi:pimeloyl-ACP methyl ester carboxylesterase